MFIYNKTYRLAEFDRNCLEPRRPRVLDFPDFVLRFRKLEWALSPLLQGFSHSHDVASKHGGECYDQSELSVLSLICP